MIWEKQKVGGGVVAPQNMLYVGKAQRKWMVAATKNLDFLPSAYTREMFTAHPSLHSSGSKRAQMEGKGHILHQKKEVSNSIKIHEQSSAKMWENRRNELLKIKCFPHDF